MDGLLSAVAAAALAPHLGLGELMSGRSSSRSPGFAPLTLGAEGVDHSAGQLGTIALIMRDEELESPVLEDVISKAEAPAQGAA